MRRRRGRLLSVISWPGLVFVRTASNSSIVLDCDGSPLARSMPMITSPTCELRQLRRACRRRRARTLTPSGRVFELEMAEVAAAIEQVAEPRAGELGAVDGRALIGERDEHPIAGVAIERAEADEFERDSRERRPLADDVGLRLPLGILGRFAAPPAARQRCAASRRRFGPSIGAGSRPWQPSFGFGGCGGGGNSRLLSSSTASESARKAMKFFLST